MDPADLAFAGIARQAELLRDEQVSPRELVELYLERIARLDPELNAFRKVFAERALTEADQAQARLRAGDERPLLGVPVAIKDNVDMAGEVATHGTDAYGEPAREDSEVVRRLRAAGAIPIGLTHLPELAAWPFTESATWGVTRNPWDRDRVPGGSSGGSAAAVAAGLAGAALGSDGAGSIRIPCAQCGLFGIKPQRDRVSLAPATEHWHGLSVLGPIARSVADAALFLDVVADRAPAEPFAAAAARPPGKLRIAVTTKPPPPVMTRLHPDVRGAVDETVDLLRSLGHDVRPRDPDYRLIGPNMIARYFRGIHDDAVAMPRPERLERRTRTVARIGGLIPPAALAFARAREETEAAGVMELLSEYDAMLLPVTAAPAIEVGRWEGRGALWTFNGVARWCPFMAPWNTIGVPAAAVPARLSREGLPVSVQLVGRPDDEATLLSLSAQLEAERPWADRRPPIS
jgi:amidase